MNSIGERKKHNKYKTKQTNKQKHTKKKGASAYLIKNSKGEGEKSHSHKQSEGLGGVLGVYKVGLKEPVIAKAVTQNLTFCLSLSP